MTSPGTGAASGSGEGRGRKVSRILGPKILKCSLEMFLVTYQNPEKNRFQKRFKKIVLTFQLKCLYGFLLVYIFRSCRYILLFVVVLYCVTAISFLENISLYFTCLFGCYIVVLFTNLTGNIPESIFIKERDFKTYRMH
jgi:hypothetical protein